MTISTTDSRISYNGNGVTTVFSFPYRFLANGDLVVLSVNAAGVETTKTLTTDYTVTGAGDDAGGSVTMLVAPASGTRLVIYRDTGITQATDYISGDPFPAETHERALDRLTMIAQEIGSDAARAIKVPTGDPSSLTTTLPAAADRLDLMMQFNSATGELEVTDFTVTEVRSAIAAAYAAGSTADAVTYVPNGTGAVSRSVQDKLRGLPASPEDFGAVGDGVTDDAVAINLALQAHKRVMGENGKTYLIGSPLVPKTGNVIDMTGASVKLKSASNTHMVRLPTGVNDVTVIGGDWDGNKAAQSSGGNGFTNAALGTNSRIRIVNATIHDCYDHGIGWAGTTTQYVIESGIFSYSNGASGVGSVGSVSFAAITGNVAYSNGTSNFGGSGISTYSTYTGNVGSAPGTADNFTGYGAGTKFVSVTGNVAKGGSNNGMHLSGDYVATVGNVVDTPATHGIVVRVETGGTVGIGATVVGNAIKSAGDSGIWLDNQETFAVVGNTVKSSTDHGIYLDTANTDGAVVGNVTKASGLDGIRLQTATDIVIAGNVSADNTSDGIQITNSTTSTIVGNRFTGNALGIQETGTSDNNLVAGVSATGNTSDTSIFANDASRAVASLLGGTRTITAASTLDLYDYCDYFVLTGATAVNNIEASYAGRVVTIRSDGSTTINDGGNLRLSTSHSLSDLDCIVLVCDGTNWYQVAAISNN